MSARHTVAFLNSFAWALYALAGLAGIALLWVYAPWVFVVWAIISVPMTLMVLALFRGGH